MELLGVRMVEGRTFTESDDHLGAPVVIVDERLAARTWPGASAIGPAPGRRPWGLGHALHVDDGGRRRTARAAPQSRGRGARPGLLSRAAGATESSGLRRSRPPATQRHLLARCATRCEPSTRRCRSTTCARSTPTSPKRAPCAGSPPMLAVLFAVAALTLAVGRHLRCRRLFRHRAPSRVRRAAGARGARFAGAGPGGTRGRDACRRAGWSVGLIGAAAGACVAAQPALRRCPWDPVSLGSDVADPRRGLAPGVRRAGLARGADRSRRGAAAGLTDR